MENNFKELQIFEDSVVNDFCDLLTDQVLKITGKKPHLVGSVAKILSGTYSENYNPKDIDFAIDNVSFRKILAYKNNQIQLFEFARMVETRPERFIIYLNDKVIELWNYFHKNKFEELKYYKNKIPFLCQ